MREIEQIVLHCSASDYAHHDNVAWIRKIHIVENGWSDIGYHWIITKQNGGKLNFGRPIWRPGAHVKGHNNHSIGICLTGLHIFSEEQFNLARQLVRHYLRIFHLAPINVVGHYELDDKKTCPNFDMDLFRGELHE